MEDKRAAAPPPTPEVDPELAAMEHEHHVHVNREDKPNLLQRLLGLVGGRKATPPHSAPREKGHRDRRMPSEDRFKRRVMARYGQDPDPRKRPHARLGRMRGRAPEASRQADARMEARQFLRKLKISRLIIECPEMKLVEHFGSVLSLASASTESIKLVKGLGPAKRKKIHAYLTGKNVPVAWKP